jgi:hypothetical protein
MSARSHKRESSFGRPAREWEPTQTQGSYTLVRRLLCGRTVFLGPKTKQSFVYLILFRLAHAPTPPPGLDFD